MKAAGVAAVLLAWGAAEAQPRRATPDAPAEERVEPRPRKVQLEPCQGVMVYVTSKVWRECCLLCGTDDAPSAAEYEAATAEQAPTIVNQYFTLSGRADEPPAAAPPAEAKPEEPPKLAAGEKPRRKIARNRYGGLVGLSPLGPRFGGE